MVEVEYSISFRGIGSVIWTHSQSTLTLVSFHWPALSQQQSETYYWRDWKQTPLNQQQIDCHSYTMDPNTSRVIFTGILDTYLVFSSLLVSFWLIVSEFELAKFLLLVLILIGNCYWIYRLQSFSRLQDFYLFIRRPSAYELPQKIYDSKIPSTDPNYRSKIFDNYNKTQSRLPLPPASGFREPYRSSFQAEQRLSRRDSGLPIANLRQMGFAESKENSMLDSKIKTLSRNVSGISNARKGQVSNQFSRLEEEQTNRLNDKCEETLESQKIRKEVYRNSLQRVKSMMSFRIQNLIARHSRNLNELNAIMTENFDMPITDCNPNGIRREGRIYLDEIVEAINYDPNLKNWRWNTTYFRAYDRNTVLARIKQLVEERSFIDKHILINKSADKYSNRQEALLHLDKLSRDPSKTDHSIQSIRNATNRQDQLALFRFFEASVNLTLPPQCQYLKIKSNFAYAFKFQDPKQMGFCLTQLQSGNMHINFVSGKMVYNCEPGMNNIYSAIYFYLREITMKYSKDIKYSNSLKDMVTDVIN